MKDDKEAKDPRSGEEGENAPEGEGKRRRMPGKKLVLFVGAPLLLLIAGGAGAHFAGLTKGLLGGDEAQVAEAKLQPPRPAIYYNLPEMLVNLNGGGGGRRSNFLKLSVSLELESSSDVTRIEAVMPRIVDNFQIYLRELRVDDLRGSAGLYRLREELLMRVNTAAQPARINDVLFKEMLVQ